MGAGELGESVVFVGKFHHCTVFVMFCCFSSRCSNCSVLVSFVAKFPVIDARKISAGLSLLCHFVVLDTFLNLKKFNVSS